MKDSIRKQILGIRNRMSEAEVLDRSRKVFNELIKSSFFNNSAHLMVYLDFKNEIQTSAIIDFCLEHQKNVYIPVCIPETHELCISRITSLSELQAGHFGIREPKTQYIRLSDSGLIDLILVPGVAFDREGNRIGFGAGYYDRFMKRSHTPVTKSALAYSFQVVEKVPSDEYDIPVDYIVTDECTISCR